MSRSRVIGSGVCVIFFVTHLITFYLYILTFWIQLIPCPSRLVSLEAVQLVQSKMHRSNLRFSPVIAIAEIISGVDYSRGCCKVEKDSTVCPTDPKTRYDETQNRMFCYCEDSLCNTEKCLHGQTTTANPNSTPSTSGASNTHYFGLLSRSVFLLIVKQIISTMVVWF